MVILAFNIEAGRSGHITIVVPEDYSTIQEAINAASLGDTIFVSSRTYNENVVVNKSVSLIGEDMDDTIIDGGKSGSVLCIIVNDVAVSNFTITKGHPDLCGVCEFVEQLH